MRHIISLLVEVVCYPIQVAKLIKEESDRIQEQWVEDNREAFHD